MTFYAGHGGGGGGGGGSNSATTTTNGRNPGFLTTINDPAVDDLLAEYQEQFCTYENASIFISTFNVNGKSPPEYFQDWLLFDTEHLPDFVVIGLQEMDLALGTYVTDNTIREDQWLYALKRNLPTVYEQVNTVRLVGIFLTIYRRADSRIPITTSVYTAIIATGFLKFGNKGGVGVSFDMNNTSVCFVNAHFAAGSELSKRNQDFREISQMRFTNGRGIYDHDIVFWLGDLNYRLDTNMSQIEVIQTIEAGQWKDLQQYDQLQRQQALGVAFNGFKELLSLPFRPTYKFDTGTTNWDSSEKQRVPAWCDRILHWAKDKHIKVSQSEYTSVERVEFSDHKPVRAVYRLASRCVDQEKKAKVYEDVLREGDRYTNNMLPQIKLSVTECNFGSVYYRSAALRKLTITNTGRSGTRFYFAPTHQRDDLPENWLTITPKSSYIPVGGVVEVTLQVLVSDAEARLLSVPGKAQIDLNCILIIRLDQGRDYFVVVDGKYQKSCFGCSFTHLKTMGNMLPKDEENALIPSADPNDPLQVGDIKKRVPIQVFWLCEAIRQVGIDKVGFRDTFSEALFHQIRDAIDNGRPMDLVSRKDHKWASMLFSALLMLMDSFQDPLFPPEAAQHDLTNDHACLVTISALPQPNLQFMDYLLEFIVEVTQKNSKFFINIQLLADSLFQSNLPKGADTRRRLTIYCINHRRVSKGLDPLTEAPILPR
uniref:IPPc domain-containing protein n=1 Tax=Panagrellus redivivus TaxID=6233 RepID=A0A7E4W1F0_PANRE